MPKVVVNTKGMEYEEWLKLRDKGIGGSDAAAIAGVNPYKSPIVVYMEKLGLYKQPPAGEAAYWGNTLEPIVRKEFVKRINKERDEQGKPHIRVTQRHALFAHDKYDFMRANIDGLIHCPIMGKGILEIKTANAFSTDEWQGDDVPNQYYIQVQHYFEVMDIDWGYIAVLIGGQKYKHYFIERDREIGKYLIEIESNFWHNHVEKRIPPVVDGSDSTTEMFKVLYPTSIDETVIELPYEAKEWAEKVEEYKEQQKALKELQQEFENKIKAVMKENEVAFAGPHKITWKTNKNGQRRFNIKLNSVKEAQLCN